MWAAGKHSTRLQAIVYLVINHCLRTDCVSKMAIPEAGYCLLSPLRRSYTRDLLTHLTQPYPLIHTPYTQGHEEAAVNVYG